MTSAGSDEQKSFYLTTFNGSRQQKSLILASTLVSMIPKRHFVMNS